MKKLSFYVVSIIAFCVPIIDLLYYMITAFYSGDKYARLSTLFMAIYYVPFGIMELIAYFIAKSLLFSKPALHSQQVHRIILLTISGVLVIALFFYVHTTFRYSRF